MSPFDVVVIGLGAMGSAALANLARRGVSVIGIEQFTRGHLLGSSSGKSRMIRKAYFEHASYVPLVLRAYEGWDELERLTGIPIFRKTGVLLVGSAESSIVSGAAKSAHAYGLPIEHLSASEIRTRFPMFAPLDGEVGLLEPDGGFITPEDAIEGFLRVAEAHGGQMLFGRCAFGWDRAGDGTLLEVQLGDGTSIASSRLIVCAGPWWSAFAGDVMPIDLQRNVQLWFQAPSPAFSIGRCPAFLLDRTDLPRPLYGFPDYGAGVKAALHGFGDSIDSPDRLDRAVHPGDVEPVRGALAAWMPANQWKLIEGKACIYALTPDRHFVVGLHPNDPHVVVAGGFSGHGFKFAPTIGEVLADLALDGGTRDDLTFLSPNRFARGLDD
jgi:sarcosine oxidase